MTLADITATPACLLAVLTANGAAFSLDAAGELVITAPKGLLTPDIRAAISEWRADLIALLACVSCRRRLRLGEGDVCQSCLADTIALERAAQMRDEREAPPVEGAV